jgi:hypothetical protein
MCRWDAILKSGPAVVTALVAICVAVIAYRQWRTARERLRLDLYNRRFEIYSKVLDFSQALSMWHGTPEQMALRAPFIKAFRESRFLFPRSSGVYNLLEEFQEHAMVVMGFEDLKPVLQTLDQETMRQYEKRTESQAWIMSAFEPLEQKMAPYLDFHKL